jgi:hypothetical protein
VKGLLHCAVGASGFLENIEVAKQCDVVAVNVKQPAAGTASAGVLRSKSGSNSWHGSAWEFLRNKVLDSKNFFNNEHNIPVGAWTQNQFGADIGGRIIKDKL